jgi:hypothetical protein
LAKTFKKQGKNHFVGQPPLTNKAKTTFFCQNPQKTKQTPHFWPNTFKKHSKNHLFGQTPFKNKAKTTFWAKHFENTKQKQHFWPTPTTHKANTTFLAKNL